MVPIRCGHSCRERRASAPSKFIAKRAAENWRAPAKLIDSHNMSAAIQDFAFNIASRMLEEEKKKSNKVTDKIHFSPFGIVWPALFGGLSCFFFISFLYRKLMQCKTGSQIGHPRLDRLAAQIKSGARAFLKEEYKILGAFVICTSIILFIVFTAHDGFVSCYNIFRLG
jgi:hypothetical protein